MADHTKQIETWRAQATSQRKQAELCKDAGDTRGVTRHETLADIADEAANRLESL